jgi:cytochrome c biogenesis protein CcmG/thiol:disulfide interchange protein DsbE
MHRRLALVLLWSMLLLPADGTAANPHTASAAPDFSLPGSSGTVSLHDLRGKVVLVDFWASWCVPCRQSFPWMTTMLERYGEQGLAVVAVNLDRNRQAADTFLGKFPAPFVVAFDPAGKTAEAFHVQAMPSSFLVSRDGTIVYSHEGFEQAKAAAVEDRIKEALSR